LRLLAFAELQPAVLRQCRIPPVAAVLRS
jgi:hypothetical protein